ncbi:unnamed protein product [Trichogramma brassicae]|uniref:Uncharacterized protein n=1 Tax=Trichogramma brassicae TaxID=86971 RepID=A0A6H5I102_9HYME|nr:unnamed protein product [Trichogramma brassicae]
MPKKRERRFSDWTGYMLYSVITASDEARQRERERERERGERKERVWRWWSGGHISREAGKADSLRRAAAHSRRVKASFRQHWYRVYYYVQRRCCYHTAAAERCDSTRRHSSFRTERLEKFLRTGRGGARV